MSWKRDVDNDSADVTSTSKACQIRGPTTVVNYSSSVNSFSNNLIVFGVIKQCTVTVDVI